VIFSLFPLSRSEMKLDDFQLGLLSTVFLWIYGFASPLGEFLSDLLGRRKVIILSLLLWTTMTLLTGYVRDFNQLLAARALMGRSEACYLPAALALIAELHAGGRQSLATGIHQTGLYAGMAFGGFAGGWLADRWIRSTVRGRVLTQIAGIVVAATFLFLAGWTDSVAVLIAAIIAFGIGKGFYDCSTMPVLAQVARPEIRATGFGVFNLLSCMAGGTMAAAAGALKPLIGLSGAFQFSAELLIASAAVLLYFGKAIKERT
jgi:MFS family permease